MATNTSSLQQKADFIEQNEEKVPESNGQDTSENGTKNAEHATFNIMMSWKPFRKKKKKIKINKWQKNKM